VVVVALWFLARNRRFKENCGDLLPRFFLAKRILSNLVNFLGAGVVVEAVVESSSGLDTSSCSVVVEVSVVDSAVAIFLFSVSSTALTFFDLVKRPPIFIAGLVLSEVGLEVVETASNISSSTSEINKASDLVGSGSTSFRSVADFKFRLLKKRGTLLLSDAGVDLTSIFFSVVVRVVVTAAAASASISSVFSATA